MKTQKLITSKQANTFILGNITARVRLMRITRLSTPLKLKKM